jgi:hypothetical protein
MYPGVLRRSSGKHHCGNVFELDPRSNPDNPDLDPFNHPSRVIDADDKLVGMVCFENYAEVEDSEADSINVQEIMQPVEPSQLLAQFLLEGFNRLLTAIG